MPKDAYPGFIFSEEELRQEFNFRRCFFPVARFFFRAVVSHTKYISKRSFNSAEGVPKKNNPVLRKSVLQQPAQADEKKVNVKKEKLFVKSKAIKPVSDKIPPADKIEAMHAELGDRAFDDDNWIFELKYDGYRALASIDGKGQVELFSRNHLSFNDKFKPLTAELKTMKHEAVIDGEAVVEDETGRSSFQLLQNYQRTGEGKIKYYAFDILFLNGNDTRILPLLERKELLKMLLEKYKFKHIFYSDHVAGKGKSFYQLAVKNKLEGIIAKEIHSPYRSGRRTGEWLKIKISQEEEAVIIGMTDPKGSRSHFGSLLLAQYHDGNLEYSGRCGTGFTESVLEDLYKKLQPFFTDESPVKEKVPAKGKVQWVKPKLICQVKFTEWTEDRIMRHPVYLGLRVDKSPEEVKKVLPELKKKSYGAGTGVSKTKATASKKGSGDSEAVEKQKSSESKKSKSTEDYDLKAGKIILHLTNQHKIYFPADKITKGDIVNYYKEISQLILPYLKDRPQSMNRFPNGISGPSFYQKDVDLKKSPEWITTAKIFSESNNEYIQYLVCNDLATLLYMANLGCIEINPWNSRISSAENPDWAVIDLDPEKIDFIHVVTVAREVKKLMDELEVPCYCKTSGATGLHIYIPMAARYDYETVKTFAHVVAKNVNQRLPEITSIERMPVRRQHKVYIDFLQNRRGQTLAAPYSVRPKPGATVSAPLEWKEVNSKLTPADFTIRTILKRVDKKGDLWKPVIGKGVNLQKIIKRLQQYEIKSIIS
jgi:bifunctional non-homologous end joining protein LigD